MRINGESVHQLDDKGRINIPRKFQTLFEQGGFLTRAFNGLSLVFFSHDAWENIQDYLSGITFTELSGDDVARFLSRGTETRLDGQGRLTIPPTLRRRARLEKDVTLIALGDKLEIWDTQTLSDYDEERMTPGDMGKALAQIRAQREGAAV